MAAYYNEIDPYAAQWLRNLIGAGHIAPGVVDERSIEDVRPSDLIGFTQCHFFAGIGAWSLALRRAGWPDDVPVWTGSCPCQPFSAAGAGGGFEDSRHLWPTFAWLIKQRKPPVVLGEQVASKAVEPWVDLVHADLEAMDYAFGAVAFPSAGVGAPHIRDRLFWVGHANDAGPQGHPGNGGSAGRSRSSGPVATPGLPVRLANTAGIEHEWRNGEQGHEDGWSGPGAGIARSSKDSGPGPVNGLWSDADWLFCRDARWRPVESGTFPLADGVAGRVGRLRAYGNAINAEAATQFIAAYLECQ